mgnify:FL=1
MSDPAGFAAARPPERPDALAGLNAAQREAVLITEGPLLVLSGAGSGKTRVLTARLAHILTQRLAYPSQILAVTFTNKAAREMQERVAALLGGPAPSLWLGTFHAMAARMLRRHAERVGLKPNFTILDTDDQLRLLKQGMQGLKLDEKRFPPRALGAAIERWKDRGLTPDKLPPEEAQAIAEGKAARLYALYQERLLALNACDFGDLMLHCLGLLTAAADVREAFQNRFRYILVDEYQDTNVAQYLWLRLLAQKSRNLCCVGDDDQSIYRWRGAEVGNILRFERDFPGAAVIRLEQNYRSTPHILGAASGLIAHNAGRLGKTLWTAAEGGEKVRLTGLWDGAEEARAVGEAIETFQRQGSSLSEIAILVRAGFQTREFEERFIVLGLPYRVIGGPRFYERAEIRDAIAYLRLVAQGDDDLAFERIVNQPKRGLGPASLLALRQQAQRDGIPLSAAAAAPAAGGGLKPKARGTLARFLGDIARWRDLMAASPPGALLQTVLEESGYADMWRQDKSIEAPGRLESLKELVAAVEDFATIESFLEHVSLVMEIAARPDEDLVSLMTLHAAKGLEFDTVFLPGWEEGLFPHPRALEEAGAAGLEEERRLAYVGITRARQRCLISFAANRRVYNQWQSSLQSRFVDELPEAHVERQGEPGLALGHYAIGGAAARDPSLAADRFDYARWAQSGVGLRSRGAAPAPALTTESEASPFPLGSRIFHEKFGYGRVMAAEGDRLEIEFEKAGRKKVVDRFVKPA